MSDNTRYITKDALVNEWITDNEYSGKIKEDLLRRWVNRGTGLIVGSENLSFHVALLDIHNFVGSLPDHLKSIFLVGCVADRKHFWNREQMKSWTYSALGTDCEVEINVKCPRCREEKCDCDEGLIELDMDQIYREERPYLTHVNYSHFVGYSAAQTDGIAGHGMNPYFHIMKPRVSNDVWWNTEYYMGICNVLGPNECSPYTYDIDNGKFITDLKEGQVLISYLATRHDADGYLLIPKVPIVIEAILAYLDLKVLEKLTKFGGNQTDRLHYYDAKNNWKDLWGTAKNKLVMPTQKKWESLIKKHWVISPDRYHYGRTHI